jgi:uncharacterized protein
MTMKTFFSDKPLKYDGTQLHSHFAYNSFNVSGDSIVSFIGPCDVAKENLVDLEDVHQGKFIFSENMLHFIIEHFHEDLTLTIAYQRLLIDCLIQEITAALGKDAPMLQRKGDDIYDDIHKLSVSIATQSPVSCLIHTGINISSKNTPLPTKGLEDYKINAQAIATGVMNRYRAELQSIEHARSKVKGCA